MSKQYPLIVVLGSPYVTDSDARQTERSPASCLATALASSAMVFAGAQPCLDSKPIIESLTLKPTFNICKLSIPKCIGHRPRTFSPALRPRPPHLEVASVRGGTSQNGVASVRAIGRRARFGDI